MDRFGWLIKALDRYCPMGLCTERDRTRRRRPAASHGGQPLLFNRRARFIEQVEEDGGVIRVSLCAIITHRSANQKVDNRRQIKSVSGQSSNGAFD